MILKLLKTRRLIKEQSRSIYLFEKIAFSSVITHFVRRFNDPTGIFTTWSSS